MHGYAGQYYEQDRWIAQTVLTTSAIVNLGLVPCIVVLLTDQLRRPHSVKYLVLEKSDIVCAGHYRCLSCTSHSTWKRKTPIRRPCSLKGLFTTGCHNFRAFRQWVLWSYPQLVNLFRRDWTEMLECSQFNLALSLEDPRRLGSNKSPCMKHTGPISDPDWFGKWRQYLIVLPAYIMYFIRAPHSFLFPLAVSKTGQ